jgi:hypothetical protein
MDITRYALAADWQQPGAIWNGVALDSAVNVSAANHPALSPSSSSTTGTAYSGAQIMNGTSVPPATLNSGNAWRLIDTIMVSSQSADQFSFTTTGQQVYVQTTGILASGLVHAGAPGVVSDAIRNGGIVGLYVDGAASPATTADLHNAAPVLHWRNPDGASHGIAVRFLGTYDAQVAPIGPVTTSGTGTCVPTLLPSTTQTSFVPATWRVAVTTAGANGTGQYQLFKTPQGGTEASVATGLVAGTTYDAANRVPGVSLRVSAPAGGLLGGDGATFSTDSVMAAIVSFRVDSGTGSTTGSYTSAVVDSGQGDSHFLLAAMDSSDLWTLATGPPAMTLSVGQTAVPDASWSTTTGILADPHVQPSGARVGSPQAGFLASPRGRYARWTFTFPTGLAVVPWIRDLRMYSWVPERDPALAGRLPMPPSWTPGPTLEAWLGLLASGAADARAGMLDLVASYAISTARGPYLQPLGADLGLAPYVYSLIPPAAYRLLLTAVSGSRPQGGSVVTMATEVDELISGAVPTTSSVVTGGLLSVTATAALPGPSTLSVTATQTAPWSLGITIPPMPWPGLAGLSYGTAKQIVSALITTISPIGCRVTPAWPA